MSESIVSPEPVQLSAMELRHRKSRQEARRAAEALQTARDAQPKLSRFAR